MSHLVLLILNGFKNAYFVKKCLDDNRVDSKPNQNQFGCAVWIMTGSTHTLARIWFLKEPFGIVRLLNF